ncbi:MAG: dimethylarginine dimethylaminohydrolase family protein [Candidatus Binatia bacterium]
MPATRVVLMGDPSYFSIQGGANPHTRTVWGRRKQVEREKAIAQWHAFARLLGRYDVRVLVIPPHPQWTGLVYPANAGVLSPLDTPMPAKNKMFSLANLLPSRGGEQPIYEQFLQRCGFRTSHLQARFEGEADFFPVAAWYFFTYGQVTRQRFRWRWGWPPYERVYGFRSDLAVLPELQPLAGGKEIIPLELCNEAYYHGDTTLCAFGPKRQFLLAYLDALQPAAVARVQELVKDSLIAISANDAALYAANSFTLSYREQSYLFMPAGVSERLQAQVRERGVEPVLIDVSEFLRKGGGAVKCMIGDLGPDDETDLTEDQLAFRRERDYRMLFPEV